MMFQESRLLSFYPCRHCSGVHILLPHFFPWI